MTKFITVLMLAVLGLGAGEMTLASSQNPESKIKTVFVFNFTKYIQWSSESQEFVIGVVGGDNETLTAFKSMAKQKSAASRKIVIREIESAVDYSTCNIIYITEENSNKLSEIKSKRLKNILIVTEKEGMAEKGSGINFVKKDGKLRFELNEKVVENSGLKVSSQLKGLAILV
ncbi:MAG: YfiR family protein [Bacteroidota bacterium]